MTLPGAVKNILSGAETQTLELLSREISVLVCPLKRNKTHSGFPLAQDDYPLVTAPCRASTP